jgi:hypothetical protein
MMCVSCNTSQQRERKRTQNARARGRGETAHLFRVLLERVDVHPRPVLRHRLDDDGTDELEQPLLTIALAVMTSLLSFFALLPPALALRFPLFLLVLLLGCRSSLHQSALFSCLLRSRGSSDDRCRLGLRAREARLVHFHCPDEALVGESGWTMGDELPRGREAQRLDGTLDLDQVIQL